MDKEDFEETIITLLALNFSLLHMLKLIMLNRKTSTNYTISIILKEMQSIIM